MSVQETIDSLRQSHELGQPELARIIEEIFDAGDSELASDLTATIEKLETTPRHPLRAARRRPRRGPSTQALALTFWKIIIQGTDRFDERILAFIKSLPADLAPRAHELLRALNERSGGAYLEQVLQAARHPHAALENAAVQDLVTHLPDEALSIVTGVLKKTHACVLFPNKEGYSQLFDLGKERWSEGGSEFFEWFLRREIMWFESVVTDLLAHDFPNLHEVLGKGFTPPLDSKYENYLLKTLNLLIPHKIPDLLPAYRAVLVGKSKPLREAGARGIAAALGEKALPEAREYLTARKMDVRISGALILAEIGGAQAIAALRSARETEEKEKVRDAIQLALHQLYKSSPHTMSLNESIPLADLEASFVKEEKRLKLPKGNWLQLDQLPTLPTTSGEPLSELGRKFLIAKQAKHKTIEPAPEVVPLLAHFDRAQTTDFALALFEQWMGSAQAAADRWVLTLVGSLGDSRAITALKEPIQSWADNSRHKLAEWAAQSIALIPGDEALMILDSLANRYRSKFKNIGRACREALETAAQNRGVSLDELGDLIVPDFGFDAERQRLFAWDGGSLIAILGPDFKLSWLNPETGKETKTIPAAAPDQVKNEVKAINKLMREGVKGQTARLEMALVRQRRWPVPRWQALYETNPLLQSFAARLVWGVYDAEGQLLHTFRRYPNGLLADASGELIELDDPAQQIGLVHPLELEAEAIGAWKDHLARFKIKAPFPQLERPVVRLDPLHGNRKEIDLTKGREVSCGSFRSRAERRGWARGSVVDAGGISSYYKSYPGAGVEVFLGTEDFYIGIDPMDVLTLGSALFAKSESIERGSYIYDEPSSSDDPRVLRFDQVSPVVYSETLSDLKAIVGDDPNS